MPSLEDRISHFLARLPLSGNSAQRVIHTCQLLGGDDDVERTIRGEAFTDWLGTLQAARRLQRETNMTAEEWSGLRAILVERHVQAWGAASAAT